MNDESLFPDAPVSATDGSLGYLPITDLAHELERGPAPAAGLKAGVALAGVIEPIVIQQQDGRYVVRDGLRRLKAAHAAGQTHIKCVAIPPGETLGLVTTLLTNQHRSPNAVVELETIERLLREAGSPETLARQLKLPLGWVLRRLKLRQLLPELRAAWERDQMSTATAERAARLGPTRQRQLLTQLDATGKLTAADVRAVRMAEASAASASLSDALFDGPDAPASSPASLYTRLLAVCEEHGMVTEHTQELVQAVVESVSLTTEDALVTVPNAE